MSRRPAVTLVEVLVAIFVMGIGLIALLTLFPLGVLSMAVAIKEQRCAESAVNATALGNMFGVRSDGMVLRDPMPTGLDLPAALGFKDAYTNPLPGVLTSATANGPSYPVLIDPAGYLSSAANQNWVGGVPGVMSRRRVSYIFNAAAALWPTLTTTYFTLLDDLDYDITNPGQPTMAGAIVNRENRYSWAYLCQRPNNSAQSLVDLSVVVFNKRPLALNSSLSLSEYVYAPNINPTYYDMVNNLITVDYTNAVPPPVRPGDWILDVTIDQHWVNAAKKKQNAVLYPHAYFYRVVSVEEIEANLGGVTRQYAQYEVQGRLRGFDTVHSVGLVPVVPGALQAQLNMSGSTFVGTSVVLEGVVEVYDRGYGP